MFGGLVYIFFSEYVHFGNSVFFFSSYLICTLDVITHTTSTKEDKLFLTETAFIPLTETQWDSASIESILKVDIQLGCSQLFPLLIIAFICVENFLMHYLQSKILHIIIAAINILAGHKPRIYLISCLKNLLYPKPIPRDVQVHDLDL